MTMYTNAQNTYAQIGIREDLANMVYRISPEETPFQSNISRAGKASNTYVEWQTQALATPAVNYALEGDDTAATAVTARVRLGNRCAISKKVYAVTGTSQAVTVAGVSDELAEQRLLKGLELKRDMEVGLLANTGYEAGGTTTARKNAGIQAYILNSDGASTNSLPGITSFTAGSGTGATAWNFAGATTRALTMTAMTAAMKNAYVQGGQPKMLLVSPDGKVGVSQLAFASTPAGLAPVRFNLNQVKAAAMIGAVDVWQSDFGALEIIPNVQMAAVAQLNTVALLIDPRYAEVAFLRPFQTEMLAKTGDSTPEHILAEYTLKVGAPRSHAFIPQLSY